MNFTILPAGIIIFVICLVLHIFIWRWRFPHYRPVVLVTIFIIIPSMAGIVIAGLDWFGFIPALNSINISHTDLLAVYLLHFAISAAYILSYPAVEAVSPSLAISLLIGDSGKRGVQYEDLAQYFSPKVLLQPRIKDLVEAGLITELNGYVSITPRGIIFVNCFILLRRLLGLPIGKG